MPKEKPSISSQPATPKTRVDLGFRPRKHQLAAHQQRKRFSVLVWHRRSGKTYFSIMELLLGACASKLPNARFAYIAPFYGQAKSVAWDILKGFARKLPGAVIREGELTVVLQNGNTVRLFGADNPDSLRGLYFDGIVLDEVADMKPMVWEEIIRPALTDRKGWAIFIGTPKGMNLFSKLYYDALKSPDWYADMKRVNDTDALDKDEIAQARREMDPSKFAQEFECDFTAAVANALIPLDVALAAYGRKISRHDHFYAPKILGCDVARFGDDRAVIFPRQGLAAFRPEIYRKLDNMQFANMIANYDLHFKADAIFIDEIGNGSGVIDRLRQLGKTNIIGVISNGKPVDPMFKDLRCEMWSKMGEWMREGGCLPECEGLVEELTAPTYWFNDQGKKVLQSNDDIKSIRSSSPDLGSALAFTFAAPVFPQNHHQTQGGGAASSNRCITDYDVLA